MRSRRVWSASFVLVASLLLALAVPPGTPRPDGPNQFPLAGLWEFLAAHPAWASMNGHRVPAVDRGGATDRGYLALGDATRAHRGSGSKPGKAPGSLDEYNRPTRGAEPESVTPKARVGFDRSTSQRDAKLSSRAANTYRNADGSTTEHVFSSPVNFQAPDGSWQPIDTTLVSGPDGWHTRANDINLLLAGTGVRTPKDRDLAATGAAEEEPVSGQLVTLTLPGGQSISYTLQGASLTEPSVVGSLAVYRNVLTATDLRIHATATGWKETLVLQSSAAANSWVFPLQLQGLTARLESDGSVSLLDSSGKQALVIPRGHMRDSRVQPDGEFTTSNAVTYELISVDGGPALRVTADRAWLADPARVYPVMVDPSAQTWDGPADVYVTETGMQNVDSLGVGCYDPDAGGSAPCDHRRSFIKFNYYNYAYGAPNNSLQGQHVTSANLHLWHTWSEDCTSYRKVYAYRVTAPWTESSMSPSRWQGATINPSRIGELLITNNYPACTNTGGDRSSAHSSEWVMPITDMSIFKDWSVDPNTNHGIALGTENDNDRLGWKRFVSRNYDPANGTNAPYLDITWEPNQVPQIDSQYPSNGAAATTLTPELVVSGSDADAWPNALTYKFVLYNSSSQLLADSGSFSASRSWVIAPGKLAWGNTYWWTVQAFDGLAYSAPVWHALSTPVPQPPITSQLSSNGGQGFNELIGNYTTSATDAQVATVGPPLAVQRSYNSRDPRSGLAFGTGWSSLLDSKVRLSRYAGDNPEVLRTVVVTYPSGQDVAFGLNADGTFTPPSGRYSVLSCVGTASPYDSIPCPASVTGGTIGGLRLTDKDGTKYLFTTAAGSDVYKLTSITDAQGRPLTLDYSGGVLQTITSKPGPGTARKLHFTWTTPAGATSPHVSQVDTDAAAAGDSSTVATWKYNYSGDKLMSVCPPEPTGWTKCWQYTYQANSLYPTVVSDLGAHTYLRFGEQPGATLADSFTKDNVDYATGTYANVTLGQTGPLPGSAATAVLLNGTSSKVDFTTKKTALGATYQSVSMWFKTSSSGVLLSYQKDAVTTGATTPGNYTPALYVGTDGKLYGEFWTGSVDPMVSAGTVNDNQWHHVVLTASGNTQTMYVDNDPIGVNKSGQIQTISADSATHQVIGAGFLGGSWPKQAHESSTDNTGYATFFQGTIADFAFYDKALRSDQAMALYQSGKVASAPLVKITRPSGASAVSAQVTYDASSGLVTQVTDANGGIWSIGAPQLGQPSMVYASQVLAAGPTDFFRLADTRTAKPVNEISAGGVATYNQVTRGVQNGPFGSAPSAPTVAGFDGSNSYVALPATTTTGDLPKSAAASVSMWFKMAAGSSAGGVLYAYQSTSLAGTPTGWIPALYVGTDGLLRGQLFWTGSINPITYSTTAVNDGLWHHVAIGGTPSSNTQTLYLDGNPAGTSTATIDTSTTSTYPYAYIGAGKWSSWPSAGASTVGYWPGQIAEFAYFGRQLTDKQVKAQFEAKNASGTVGTWGMPVKTVAVTLTNVTGQPATTTAYDVQAGGRLIATIDPNNGLTQYRYDTGGFQYSVTDPLGNTTTTQHDVRGNVLASISCQNHATEQCSTTTYTYYAGPTDKNPPADPRNDLVTSVSDPNGKVTSYTYDASGNRLTVTDPLNRVTQISYTNGTTSTGGVPTHVPPPGLPWRTIAPSGATETAAYYNNGNVYSLIDAAGLKVVNTFDLLGRITARDEQSDTYPHLFTTLTYDKLNRITSQTDPTVNNRVQGPAHTAKTVLTYDDDGNVLTKTVQDTTGYDASRTTTNAYNNFGQLVSVQDPAGNVTTYSYDARGNRQTQTVPVGTTAVPKTVTTTYEYEPAGKLWKTIVNGWTGDPNNPIPAENLPLETRTYDLAGRLKSITDAQLYVTSYTYTDNNLLVSTIRSKTSPAASFVLETNSYDPAGHLTSKVTNNGRTATNYTVDAAGRTETQTVDPAGVNRTTTYIYNVDDTVASQTTSGASGTQTVDARYDAAGRILSRTIRTPGSTGGPGGWWKLDETSGTTAADSASNPHNMTATGGVTWSGGAVTLNGSNGSLYTTTPALVGTASFTVSAWIKRAAGGNSEYCKHAVTEDGNQASIFWLSTCGTLWEFGRPTADTVNATSAYVNAPLTYDVWTHLVGVYDNAAGTLKLYKDGVLQGSVAAPAPTGAAVNGSLRIGLGKYNNNPYGYFNGSIDNVQFYQRAIAASDVSTLYGGGRVGSGISTSDVTISWTRDKRGLPTSQTDPNGNVTYFDHDEAGRHAATTYPTVTAEENSTPASVPPMTFTGYNTFGEVVETKDPKGRMVVVARDANGNPATVTKPSYTPPGGTTIPAAATTSTFYANGLVKTTTDPTNNTSSYVYDQLGRIAYTTAPDSGLTRTSYDLLGNVLAQTDPTGGNVQALYDYLGRTTQHKVFETKPAAATYTTTYAYDDTVNTGGGFLTVMTPPGLASTTYTYNNLGEVTRVTDGAGHKTDYAYDFAGRTTTRTLDDLSKTVATFDGAGNLVKQEDFNSTGASINVVSAGYDPAGNTTSTTDGNGHTTTYTYDAMGWLRQQVEPVSAGASITTTFGYNVAGERTRFTDGRGNVFITTYNSWGLPEKLIEPATTAYPAEADRTFTTAYNAAGQPSVHTMPGGVTITSTYTNGRLTRQAGAGAEAPTTDRVFTYDLAGRIKTIAADGGTNTLSYNDRGQLLSTSWGYGSSSFTYDNPDGSLHTRTDAAGTTTYNINPATGLLSQISNPTNGVQADYTYDNLNRLAQITYGGTGNKRVFTYDVTNRTVVDDLKTSGGTAIAKITYGFDNNGNETSKTTTGFTGSTTNTYTYDWANRLTAWTAGSTTTTYGYDNSGNRTQIGSRTFTYDQRNRLLTSSAGGTTYTYTKRGTLASSTTGTVTLATECDAFGQVAKQYTSPTEFQSYTYDALGRAIKPGFNYTGLGNNLATDATTTYTRGPTGKIIGVKQGGTSVLVWTDRHTDVVGLFTPTGTTLSGSTTYDPLGKTLATSGMMGNLGYQSGWTEPSTGRVNMHNRWYNTDTAQFDTRDTVSNSPSPASAGGNRYAYANGNPMTGIDPDGHKPMFDDYQDFKAWNATQKPKSSSDPAKTNQSCDNASPSTRSASCPALQVWVPPTPNPSCDNPNGSLRSAACGTIVNNPKDGNAKSCRSEGCTPQYIPECNESLQCLIDMVGYQPIETDVGMEAACIFMRDHGDYRGSCRITKYDALNWVKAACNTAGLEACQDAWTFYCYHILGETDTATCEGNSPFVCPTTACGLARLAIVVATMAVAASPALIGLTAEAVSFCVVVPIACATIAGRVGTTVGTAIVSSLGGGEVPAGVGAKPVGGAANEASGWPTIGQRATNAIEKQISENSCGAACAITMMRDRSIRQADISLDALGPEHLRDRMNVLSSRSWSGGYLDATSENLNALSSNGQWMALLAPEAKPGHWVIVNGIDEFGNVKILDPRGLAYSLAPSDFLNLWTNRGGIGGVVYR